MDCIVVLRPTKIRSLYCQMVGRGTRLCEAKDDLLLLDFLWHTERHELCHPSPPNNLRVSGSEIMTKKMEDGQLDPGRLRMRHEARPKQLQEMKNRKWTR